MCKRIAEKIKSELGGSNTTVTSDCRKLGSESGKFGPREGYQCL